MRPAALIVLGPQRIERTVRQALEDMHALTPRAQYSVVTAGWEEREGELVELEEHLGAKAVNLDLFGRGELVFEQDPELAQALGEHHRQLGQLQDFYRLRLSHALEATRVLLKRRRASDIESILDEQRAQALADVRRLDEQHAERIAALHAAFEARWSPSARDAVAAQRRELERVLDDSEALMIAGGHVLVLLNRLRLFDLLGLHKGQPLLCWSAGAMVLSERVIVFHDNPPQGAGNPEVLETGLGLVRKLVPLPHASARLRLEDPLRVALFSRRFGPAISAVLDQGARLDWDGSAWQARNGTRHLCDDGALSAEWNGTPGALAGEVTA